ncbi:MAG: glycosyltransferase [Pseudomonadota bacterium]
MSELRYCILLATYNGEPFIDEQIKSIAEQGVVSIDRLVSDDGSTDDTLGKIAAWQNQWTLGKIEIRKGPQSGFSENFRSLICNAPEGYDFYAYCDQDDIWMSDKLTKATETLSRFHNAPSLYCGRTHAVDNAGNFLGFSPQMMKEPCFENAIVQSIAGGNTMVFNDALMNFLRKSGAQGSFVAHDWWTYMLATGVGAHVVYDSDPKIYYRQHGENLIGTNNSVKARFTRLKMALDHQLSRWMDTNLSLLDKNRDLLLPENEKLLDKVIHARSHSQVSLLNLVFRRKIFRQSFLGNMSLAFCAMLYRL